MKNILLIAVTCFLLTLGVSAQSIQERISKVDDAKQFTAEYDKFKNITWLSTHVMFRYPKGKISVLQCDVKARLQDGAATDLYGLVFIPKGGFGSGTGWQLLKSHHLIFLLDGEAMDMGDGHHDGNVGRYGVTEWVVFELTPEQMQKIAAAKKVEIQLGPFEGEIETDGQPRLKTIIALAQP